MKIKMKLKNAQLSQSRYASRSVFTFRLSLPLFHSICLILSLCACVYVQCGAELCLVWWANGGRNSYQLEWKMDAKRGNMPCLKHSLNNNKTKRNLLAYDTIRYKSSQKPTHHPFILWPQIHIHARKRAHKLLFLRSGFVLFSVVITDIQNRKSGREKLKWATNGK